MLKCRLLCIVEDLIHLEVNEVVYVYCLDRAKHRHFTETLEYKPGKALNYIKAEAYWEDKQ